MTKINNNKIQSSGDFFETVQLSSCFDDSKFFVDMSPKKDPKEILADFNKEKSQKGFNLKDFVLKNFNNPIKEKFYDSSQKDTDLASYIENMWDFLTQDADIDDPNSTLISLPKPYIIPGGRFREVYYWDTYFTCEGLLVNNKLEMIKNIAENFKYLIDNIGFIPNGNRTYYLTRSQPPLFFLIVNILYRELGIKEITKYIPTLEKEYSFWMSSNRNVNGLNRYWDDSETPRPESHLEDITHAQGIDNKGLFYRNIKAACESGWDFSSRWLIEANNLKTIQTTNILPIDLNSYIYGIENSLAKWFKEINEVNKADRYNSLAQDRKQKIQSKFWNEKDKYFYDLNISKNETTNIASLACTTPLFLEIATSEQASYIAQHIENNFLTPHGLLTTLDVTSQQWDSPNAWAPLQYQTVIGLEKYGYHKLAKTIASRFVNTVNKKYKDIGKIREKYDVINPESKAIGGEYIVQDGFGWTNGVVATFIKKYNLEV